MSDYIKRIRTDDGDKQIDYKSLANLPPMVTNIDDTATDDDIPTAKAVNDLVKSSGGGGSVNPDFEEALNGKVDKVENYGLIHIDDYFDNRGYTIAGVYDLRFVGINTVAGSEVVTICTKDYVHDAINSAIGEALEADY